MRFLITALFVISAFAFSAAAQKAETTAPAREPVLKVEVEGGKTLALTAKDLAKFARREAKAKAHDGKEAVYAGFDLSEILVAAGARLGKDELRGKELGAYLVVEAADGYRAVFALAELSADFTDRLVMLADTRDGRPLGDKHGPWQLIVPDDKKHGRWVRQVAVLKIRKVQ